MLENLHSFRMACRIYYIMGMSYAAIDPSAAG
jgi:hypothetical protein